MTLMEKYERGLQDSENFITGEKENVTVSYRLGEQLGRFFNDELDYTEMNIHVDYPNEMLKRDDWDVKIKFQLRKRDIDWFADSPYVYRSLATLADSDWSKGEPEDSEAKEIMRGMKDVMVPIQDGLGIKTVGVEWAVHVPDCTTFFVSFFYKYIMEEGEEEDIATS